MKLVYLVRMSKVESDAKILVDPDIQSLVNHLNRGYRETDRAEYESITEQIRRGRGSESPHGPGIQPLES